MAGLITSAFVETFHPLFFVLSFVFMSIAEVAVQMRWRLHLKCPHCGFDPLLYMKSPKLAAAAVNTYIEKQRHDPAFLLRPDPLRHLQKRL